MSARTFAKRGIVETFIYIIKKKKDIFGKNHTMHHAKFFPVSYILHLSKRLCKYKDKANIKTG